MTAASIEVVRRMYEAFHGDDPASALEHFDPDVVVDLSPRPDGSVGKGRDFLNRMIGQWTGAFEGWREEIEEISGTGERVYVNAVQRGRGKGSGAEVEQRYAIVYEVAGERIARMTVYWDLAEARRDAGLDP